MKTHSLSARRAIYILIIFLFISPFIKVEQASADAATIPILVVVNGSYSSNRFGNYLGEILRAEGLNAYVQLDLSQVNLTELQGHSLTILAETTLTSGQATMFSDYVNGV